MQKEEAYQEFEEFRASLKGESDRGAVLNATSYLDQILHDLLETVLLDCKSTKKLLEGPYAPLGTYAARLDTARALALIPSPLYDNLEGCRRIRNDFAHDYNTTFAIPSIADRTRALRYDDDEKEPNDPRRRFILVACRCMGHLHAIQVRCSDRRLRPDFWRN